MNKTFREVATSYLEHGGDNRYVPKIIEYFGDRDITTIFPFDVRKMVADIYPNHLASTMNRHGITPCRSVINHGYDRGWCSSMRIKSFKVEVTKRDREPASQIWMYMFLRQCDIDKLYHLAAAVLFMHQTAARVSEAVALKWEDVDMVNRRVILKKTKTSVNSPRSLTDELVRRMTGLKKIDGKNVFYYNCRFSVNERIFHVCKRAGIQYKSSHLVGRHSFATNAISLGFDTKTAMEAGGWKSSGVFLDTYVHSPNASRTVADKFNSISYTM